MVSDVKKKRVLSEELKNCLRKKKLSRKSQL